VSDAQDTLVRFRDGVALEPLVDGWPAWLLTMDPITAGFFRRRHLEILRSYLAFPDRHARAISDPRLTGGTFSDLARVPRSDVEAYVKEYERRSAPYTSFADALDETNALLASDPRRLPTPSELPTALQGHVEMVRSDVGFPALRVLRGPDADSVALSVALWEKADRRPSFGGTPRLGTDPRVQVSHAPLAQLQAVAELNHRSLRRSEVRALGDVTGLALTPLVTEASPVERSPVPIRFLGHASVGIQLDHGLLVTDPLPPVTSEAARAIDDVTCIVISHGHPDHFNPEALLPLVGQQPRVLVPRADGGSRFDASLAEVLRRLGFVRVDELGPYECVAIDAGVEVTALPFLGEHGGLPIHGKAAFRIATPRFSTVVAADATGIDPDVFDHASTRGGTDLLCIGIEPAGAQVRWLYGPLLAQAHVARRMGDEPMSGADAHEVLSIARVLGVRQVAVYGTGAPRMEHLLGRASSTQSRSSKEAAILRSIATDDSFGITLLEVPGQAVPIPGVL
jgi:L-ascorbate metabolism protein UlaG (beta-lactamase superfamily)